MEIDKVLIDDLKNFYKFINKCDVGWVNETQEIILTCLSLLINKDFYDLISALRIKHKVPYKWFINPKLNSPYEDEWVELHEKKSDTTLTEFSDEFSDICVKCGVSPKKYNYLVFGYFYLADVKVDLGGMVDEFSVYDHFKYNCGIELISGNKPSFTDRPAAKDISPKAFIRFYKDTTINQLHEYIDKNKNLIRFIQNKYAGRPQPYPHTKSYGQFKRDIQIYLLHLLGKKTPEIIDTIYKKYVPKNLIDTRELEKLYLLEDTAVRQIISDVKTRIHNATKGSFKV